MNHQIALQDSLEGPRAKRPIISSGGLKVSAIAKDTSLRSDFHIYFSRSYIGARVSAAPGHRVRAVLTVGTGEGAANGADTRQLCLTDPVQFIIAKDRPAIGKSRARDRPHR
jgi:hypothetical protein